MAKETTNFVRKLAHNDAATRNAAFTALKNFLKSKALKKLDLLEMEKLWRGLYFSMWYCDKPIPQQNLAGNLGELFSQVVTKPNLPNFQRAFWAIIAKEWPTIDKWRIDKYLMLVRRVLRHSLFRLQGDNWKNEDIESFLEVLQEFPLRDDPKFPQSLAYHVCDIYLDEIEYVIFKDLREDSQEDESESESEDDEEDDKDEGEDKEETEKSGKKQLSEDEAEKLKAKIIKETPIAKLIEPFEKMAATAKNRALREKIKSEVTEDERLQTWGVVASDKSADSDDEWAGF